MSDISVVSTIAAAVVVLAVVAALGFVGIGLYRARYAAAREEGYRDLAARGADGSRAMADELAGVRTELAEVRDRLAALERLLSQIG